MNTLASDDPTIPKYVEVVVPVPLRRTFTYRLPPEFGVDVMVGSRLLLPFGKRDITGYAVMLHTELPKGSELIEAKLKDVIELLDDVPLLTGEIIALTRWTASYYLTSWGEVLKAALPAGINIASEKNIAISAAGRFEIQRSSSERPSAKMRFLTHLAELGETSRKSLEKTFGKPVTARALSELNRAGSINIVSVPTVGVKPKRRKRVRLLPSPAQSLKPLTDTQERTLDQLRNNGGELLFTDLQEKADVGGSTINTLAKRGLVEIFVDEVLRDPLAGETLPDTNKFTLTSEQATALTEIEAALNSKTYQTFLLHGVTGSGKTEIYIRAMRKVLDLGKSALMLVPEIALTPIFSRRLRAVFGKEVAILHSNLSRGERYDEWRRIRRGDARVAIGTRSAVFAPLDNIALVIVDEEHDGSYRQHETPFYHGRDVAVMRARFASAVAVLGSATPALESFHNAKRGKYSYLSLSNRIENRPLAAATLIDMREVFRSEGKDVTFSPALLESIGTTHAKGEQSIILLNRRGFSQFVMCRSCGETLRCKHCDITLTYHKRDSRLLCHYCGYSVAAPKACPFCSSEYLYFIGDGTEKLEHALVKKFPELRIARVDRDTTVRRRDMEKILLKFAAGGIDMLVGTQMIAKGHDFPNVTLVGVISVDLGLGLPDLRSAERTFQLLTQVAGRAGRGERPGRVLIQTYHPEHYALRHAVKQDYDGFYKEEIRYRERMGYPPFSVLASILIRHSNLKYASQTAEMIKRSLVESDPDRVCRVLGPAPASLSRLKDEYRIQLLIKAKKRTRLREILDIALADAESKNVDLRIAHVEIDPINLL